MLIFSNLEFTCSEWITMLCDSDAMSNHIKGIWSFKKRVEIILELITEYDKVNDQKKELWISLWKTINSKIPLRNIVAHNPPFDNYGLEFDSDLVAKTIVRAVEIHRLSKPLGQQGSGVTLNKLRECNIELRNILVQLHVESGNEMSTHRHRNS